MTRGLIVEGEAGTGVADLHDPAVEDAELRRRDGSCFQVEDALPARQIGGLQPVLRQQVEHVGEEQLLMLLLVGEPQHHQGGKVRIRSGIGQQGVHGGVDMVAVGHHLRGAGTGDHSPRSARLSIAQGLVIGVEQVLERRIERFAPPRQEQEGLEEPGRVSQMPLGRARVRHRLGAHVLGRQRCGQRPGHGANVGEAFTQMSAADINSLNSKC